MRNNVKVHNDVLAVNSSISEFGNFTPDEKELISNYKKLDRWGQHKTHVLIYEELDRINSAKVPNAKMQSYRLVQVIGNVIHISFN